MADTQSPSPKTPNSSPKKMRYTVVPFPKVVFFYPLTITCIICGILEFMQKDQNSATAGALFIVVFLINVMVISFDFTGVKALAMAFSIIAMGFGVLYLNTIMPILDPVKEIAQTLFRNVHASESLYFMVGAILFLMIGSGILSNLLWNRWTIEPTRLIHKHSLLGDSREYPVIDLQVEKCIDDVFEYLLLLSGTLTFQPGPSVPTIRLENVPFINRAEKKVRDIVRRHH